MSGWRQVASHNATCAVTLRSKVVAHFVDTATCCLPKKFQWNHEWKFCPADDCITVWLLSRAAGLLSCSCAASHTLKYYINSGDY